MKLRIVGYTAYISGVTFHDFTIRRYVGNGLMEIRMELRRYILDSTNRPTVIATKQMKVHF